MEGDDKYGALRQVLKERCSGLSFSDDDVKKLVDAGFETEADFGAITKEALISTLLGCVAKVAVLLKTFSTTPSLENGKQIRVDHPLSKFVASLRDSTLQERIKSAKSGSVLKLPEGINWLRDRVDFSNELFMRPSYSELIEAKEEYFRLNKDLRGVVYTGIPGIGKSHLCAYLVALELLKDIVVYFERRPPSEMQSCMTHFYRLDLKNSSVMLSSSNVLDFIPMSEKAVYIVDGGPPSCFNPPFAETQIFASPS